MKKIILILIYTIFWRNFLKIFIGLKYNNRNNLKAYISDLKKEMYKEAESLNFEKAARLRDEISQLEKNELDLNEKI